MKKVRDCFEYNNSVFRQGPTRNTTRLDERVSLEGMRREGLWGRFGLGLSRCDHGLFYTTRFELDLENQQPEHRFNFAINPSVTAGELVVGEREPGAARALARWPPHVTTADVSS